MQEDATPPLTKYLLFSFEYRIFLQSPFLFFQNKKVCLTFEYEKGSHYRLR